MSEKNTKIKGKNLAIIAGILVLGFIMLCIVWYIVVKLFPGGTVSSILNEKITNSEYYFEEMEVLSYDLDFWSGNESVDIKISIDKSLEMVEENRLKSCASSPGYCSEEKISETKKCFAADIAIPSRVENLCIDTENGLVSYWHFNT